MWPEPAWLEAERAVRLGRGHDLPVRALLALATGQDTTYYEAGEQDSTAACGDPAETFLT